MNNLTEILKMTDDLTIEEIAEMMAILTVVSNEHETRGNRITASEANDILDEAAERFAEKIEKILNVQALN